MPDTGDSAPKKPGVVAHVLRVPLPEEKLRALTRDERALLFLLGYAANQIALLFKLVMFSSSRTPEDSVEQKLSAAQTQMLARFTVGALAEAWELVRARFLSNSAGATYVNLLDQAGRDALDLMKQHFSQSSLLHKLRNNISFHYPSTDAVESAFERASSDSDWADDWNVYLAQSHLNAFYFGSDLVILHAIMESTGEKDLIQAQAKLMNEVTIVGNAMIEFIYAFFAALWLKRFGSEIEAEVCGDVGSAPDIQSIWIPFFVRAPLSVPAGV